MHYLTKACLLICDIPCRNLRNETPSFAKKNRLINALLCAITDLVRDFYVVKAKMAKMSKYDHRIDEKQRTKIT